MIGPRRGYPASETDALDVKPCSSAAEARDERPGLFDQAEARSVRCAGDLGSMIALVRTNEQLFLLLQSVSRRLHAARSYLAADDCNVNLGLAYYRYWRVRHSGALVLLRANRLQGRRTLGQIDHEVLQAPPEERRPASLEPESEPLPASERLECNRQTHPEASVEHFPSSLLSGDTSGDNQDEPLQ